MPDLAFAGLWITITLTCYVVSLWLFKRTGNNVILHPILVSAALVLVVVYASKQAVVDVVDSIYVLHWLLGPTTVALAIPIYRQVALVKQLGMRLFFPIVVGGFLAPFTAWGILALYNSPDTLQLTILTKSITTPLAMDTASLIGGIPTIAAIIVIITGIVGAICAKLLYRLCRIKEDAVKGLMLGIFAHGIGTSQALQISERAGAFASLALGINGILTAGILSVLFA